MPRKTAGRDQAYLVTDARQPRSADIARRERRYLVIMGVRLLCFLLAGLLVWLRAGWFALIPAVGAILLPYFAVVVANVGRGGRQPTGFVPYEPSLPPGAPPGEREPNAPPRAAQDDPSPEARD